MAKMLIVAEKPSVARDIAHALGGFSRVEDWLESSWAIVSSGIGHLVKIHVPEAATTGNDLGSLPIIPTRFELQPIARTRAQFNLLAKLMRRSDVDQVVNACDAGREGELIFRLIYELAGCRKPIRRMWLQSMTAESIQEAYDTMRPGSEFDALSDAARCRSEADWLIGINGSRGITRLRERETQRYELMTAGRVQTPTLAILVHRELAIRDFVPQAYWEVHAIFATQAGSYVGKWFNPSGPMVEETEDGDEGGTVGNRFFDRAQADAIVAKCRDVHPTLVKESSKATTRAPPKLFDLTGLQREANKRLKYSAKKTLDLAQALYERHRATTYPRTDSTALPEDYLAKTKDILTRLGDSAYAVHADRVLKNAWVVPNRRIFDNAKISDHFAIIPTGIRPVGSDEGEAMIYDLVVRRFIAAFHPPAEYRVTARITQVAGESFKSRGKVLVRSGWLEVYGSDDNHDKIPILCPLTPGEAVRTAAMESKAMWTQPPPRFTEAMLLAAMEGAGKLVDDDELREAMKERGLGTPATQASHIEGLLSNKGGHGRTKQPYVTREGKAQHLVPQAKGIALIEFLEGNGLEALASPRMTAEWEQKLREMEKGRYSRQGFMTEIAAMTRHIIHVIRQKAGSFPTLAERALGVPCPKCGGEVLARPRTFECAAGCGLRLWREICKRELSEAEGGRLLREGVLERIEGFVSTKTRRPFAAGLKLNTKDWKADFVFDERPAVGGLNGSESGAAALAIGAPCPKCGGTVRDQGRAYACDQGDFKLWSDVAGRHLDARVAERLLRERAHPPLNGFKNSRGRLFSAGLRLSPDLSKVEFIFQ